MNNTIEIIIRTTACLLLGVCVGFAIILIKKYIRRKQYRKRFRNGYHIEVLRLSLNNKLFYYAYMYFTDDTYVQTDFTEDRDKIPYKIQSKIDELIR